MPKRLRRGLDLVETGLLVALLTAMIGVAAYQILARNLFGGGITWGSDLVHVAMLWATMVGAVAAARENRHIKIDLVSRFAGPRLRRVAESVTSLFAAVLCGTLAWYSIEFIRVDFEYGTPGLGDVPAWVCESIIPVAGGAMALDYLARAVWPARPAQNAADDQPDSGETGP